MSRKCSICGNTVADDRSAFCNKCGAQLLEREVLTCQTCGKTFSDGKSRFCNMCGTPLSKAAPVVSPSQTDRGKICPECGNVNPSENQFYCKNCGAYILKTGSDKKPQKTRMKNTEIRIIDDSPNIAILKSSSRPEKEQVLQRHSKSPIPRQNRPGSYRKLAAAIAGIILLIIVIAVLVVYAPGILQTRSGNASTQMSAAHTDTAPGGITPVMQTYSTPPIINEGARVTTDPILTPPIINEGARVTTDTILNVR